jgi:hypothetical protein
MPTVSSYFVVIVGSPSDLSTIQEILAAGLEKTEECDWGDYLLHLDAVFPDIDPRSEQTFLGIDSEIRWPRPEVEDQGRTWEHGVFQWDANRGRFRFSGESKWLPPVDLARRVTARFSGIRIEVGGTVEHTEFLRWSVQDGLETLTHHAINRGSDFREHRLVWDGVDLTSSAVAPPHLACYLEDHPARDFVAWRYAMGAPDHWRLLPEGLPQALPALQEFADRPLADLTVHARFHAGGRGPERYCPTCTGEYHAWLACPEGYTHPGCEHLPYAEEHLVLGGTPVLDHSGSLIDYKFLTLRLLTDYDAIDTFGTERDRRVMTLLTYEVRTLSTLEASYVVRDAQWNPRPLCDLAYDAVDLARIGDIETMSWEGFCSPPGHTMRSLEAHQLAHDADRRAAEVVMDMVAFEAELDALGE